MGGKDRLLPSTIIFESLLFAHRSMPSRWKNAILIASTLNLINAIAKDSGPENVTLEVATDGGNKSSPLLYGIMFEVSIFPTYDDLK